MSFSPSYFPSIATLLGFCWPAKREGWKSRRDMWSALGGSLFSRIGSSCLCIACLVEFSRRSDAPLIAQMDFMPSPHPLCLPIPLSIIEIFMAPHGSIYRPPKSLDILMFVCLQKEAKQYWCHKLDCTYCSDLQRSEQSSFLVPHHCLTSFWRQTSKSQET